MRIGLREANQRFSRTMKAVRGGTEVVLTERGKPIALIKPLHGAGENETPTRRWEVAGQLRPAAKSVPLPPWTPRRVRGKPLSRTIREERDSS